MDIDERIINDARFSVSAYRHASSSGLPRPSSVTSHPQPFQDPYSLSMKERLEQYSGRRPCAGPSHTWGPPSNLHLNTSQPAVHVAWRSTPERETFNRASPTASPTWTPINAPIVVERNSPPGVDPLLTAIPHLHTEERPRPFWLRESSQEDQDTLKRCRKGDGALRKRQRVGYGPWRPPGRVETVDSGVATTPASPQHREAVNFQNEPIVVPVTRDAKPLPKPEERRREAEQPDYSCKEREAAFSLMNMHQDPQDTTNTKRWRAKSV